MSNSMSASVRFMTLLLMSACLAASQAPAPTQGVPFLRLIWGRVADFNGELGSVECTEFSPDGRLLASATKYSNEIAVWRVADGVQLWSTQAEQEVERVAFSPDGKWLAAGAEDDLLRVFHARDGKLHLTLQHTEGIDSLRWSPDGSILATGEETGIVRLWSMPEGKLLRQGKVEGAVNELDFTSDGKLLLVVGDKTGARVFETANMKVVRVLHVNGSAPTIAGRFSPDDQLAAVGGHEGKVQLWRLADAEPGRLINFTGRKVETLVFSPEGGHILYAGHDPHIRVVRISDGSLVHQSAPVDNAEYVTFSRNGSFVASAHQDGVIRLWVWMRGDPDLNRRLHSDLMRRQAEEDARKAPR
jgi:WD40 repeat protein